jgi:hypothetical protein
VNILNKVLAADNMWASSFEDGLTASCCKKVTFYEVTRTLVFHRFLVMI